MKLRAYIAIEPLKGKKVRTIPIVEGELLFVTKYGKDGSLTGKYNAEKHLGKCVPFELRECLITIRDKR
jgi:hypothetical protein